MRPTETQLKNISEDLLEDILSKIQNRENKAHHMVRDLLHYTANISTTIDSGLDKNSALMEPKFTVVSIWQDMNINGKFRRLKFVGFSKRNSRDKEYGPKVGVSLAIHRALHSEPFIKDLE